MSKRQSCEKTRVCWFRDNLDKIAYMDFGYWPGVCGLGPRHVQNLEPVDGPRRRLRPEFARNIPAEWRKPYEIEH